MISQYLLFFFFALLSLCLADDASAPASQVNNVIKGTWSADIIGIILITVGSFLAFTGKRFFKIFLGVSGLLSFGVLGLNLIAWIHEVIFTIPHLFYVSWAVAGVCGILGAFLCFKMWEIGVLAMAGFGGYSLGVWIMSMKSGHLITGYMTRNAFVTACTCAAIAAAWFFDELAIVISSGFSGALAIVLGIDCFINWGLKEVVLSMIFERDFKQLANVNMYVYIELGGVAALAVLGVVVQLLTGASKKGSAKSDRV